MKSTRRRSPKKIGHRDDRRRDLAKIHIAKKQLAMGDAAYREMLVNVAGVESAGDLDAAGRMAVLSHMRRIGFKSNGKGRPHFPGRPKASFFRDADIGPMLRKVEAMLAEARRPWSYAHAMAKRMGGVDRIEWCSPKSLHGIVVALIQDAKKHGRWLG